MMASNWLWLCVIVIARAMYQLNHLSHNLHPATALLVLYQDSGGNPSWWDGIRP